MFIVLIWDYGEVVTEAIGLFGTKSLADAYIKSKGYEDIAMSIELKYEFVSIGSRN